MSVANAGHQRGEMRAAKVLHLQSQQPISLVGIRSTLRDDLYIILSGAAGKRAFLHVLLNPLVMWIWIGAGIITVGTLVAALPELRRQRKTPGVLQNRSNK